MVTRYVRRLTPLAVMATLLMTNPATAEPALEVGPDADLVAGGAGIEVPVAVVCDPDADPGGTQSLFVQVRQAGGHIVASGAGFTDDLVCDGEPQDIALAVLADPGSRPFRKGEAAVQASLTLCSLPPEAGAPGPTPGHATPPETSPAPEPGPPPEPGPVPAPGDGGGPCRTINVASVISVRS
jgi:hypothetical protein